MEWTKQKSKQIDQNKWCLVNKRKCLTLNNNHRRHLIGRYVKFSNSHAPKTDTFAQVRALTHYFFSLILHGKIWEIVVKKMGKSVICLSNKNSFDETDDIYTTPKRKNIPKISGLSSPSGLCRTPGYGVHSRYTQVSPDSGFELTPSPSSNDKEFKPSSVK